MQFKKMYSIQTKSWSRTSSKIRIETKLTIHHFSDGAKPVEVELPVK